MTFVYNPPPKITNLTGYFRDRETGKLHRVEFGDTEIRGVESDPTHMWIDGIGRYTPGDKYMVLHVRGTQKTGVIMQTREIAEEPTPIYDAIAADPPGAPCGATNPFIDQGRPCVHEGAHRVGKSGTVFHITANGFWWETVADA
jgi:hypothetical protein